MSILAHNRRKNHGGHGASGTTFGNASRDFESGDEIVVINDIYY